jgi:membrane AbrB-like protein
MIIWRWISLVLLTTLTCAALTAVHFPAAMLLGALAAGVVVAIQGGELRLSRVPVLFAQAIVGLVIARGMSVEVLAEILRDWHLLLASGIGILMASTALGCLLARFLNMPGATGVWGLMPGAATAITLIADANGADARLVALMQCSRIALVALLAAAISWHFGSVPPATAQGLASLNADSLPLMIALLVLCAVLGGISRIPAGPLLMAILFGALLQGSGLASIELPSLLLAAGYATIGWSVGLRFTRPVMSHAASLLPWLLVAICMLIGLCGLIALALVKWAGVAPLTAYLATSPGGVDSIAIIASGSEVDMPFVMAFQTVRFLIVIFIGPVTARWILAKRPG